MFKVMWIWMAHTKIVNFMYPRIEVLARGGKYLYTMYTLCILSIKTKLLTFLELACCCPKHNKTAGFFFKYNANVHP